MAVFGCQIFKSFGGRSARFVWSNTYHFNSQVQMNNPVLRESAAQIVAAEKTAHYQNVHFMRAHIFPVRQDLFAPSANDFVTVELADRGARQLVGELSPLEVCLVVRRDAETGRAGSIFYRGCLADADLENSADNSFQLEFPEMFQGPPNSNVTLVNMLNNGVAAGEFVLPVHGINPVNLYRTIVNHRLGGVALRQVGRKTTSVAAATEAAAQRKANELGRRARKVLGDSLISALSGDKLALLRSLLNAFFALRATLPIEAQASLRLPFPLSALEPA